MIRKVLTHNIALCEHEGEEILLFGKGIAFKKRAGEILTLEEAETVYQIRDMKQRRAYETLVAETDEEIVAVSEEIIALLADEFCKEYYEGLHVSLLDHLRFAIKRLKENIEINNIFLDETKYMYPKEYDFAKKMVRLANERLRIKLPDAEISFICMHIHSAIHGVSAGISSLSVSVVSTCVKLVEQTARVKLEEDSLLKQRLVTHLKFAIKRAMDKVQLENPMDGFIKSNYEEAYRIGEMLSLKVKEEYGLEFSEGETAYLAIHIQSIIMGSRKEKAR